MSRAAVLRAELDAARDDFLAALERLGPDAATRPVLEDWNVRDVVWHVGFWADHGAQALELALDGRGAAFDYDTDRTDAMNAAETIRGRAMDLPAALDRERAAHARLGAAIARLDDRLLDRRLGNGDTVQEVLRYDGPDHYIEHAGHLRAAR